MKREAVESSNLKSVGYSFENKLLEVEFQNGAIYQYVDVSAATHNSLMAAASKGGYFNQFIKDKYHTARIKEPDDRHHGPGYVRLSEPE